jgi:hypothetical protein
MDLSQQQQQILERQLHGHLPRERINKKGLLEYTTLQDRVILLVSFVGAILGGALNSLIGVQKPSYRSLVV